MDEEAKKIVDDAYARVLELLGEKQAQLQALAELLSSKKETINHDDIVDCSEAALRDEQTVRGHHGARRDGRAGGRRRGGARGGEGGQGAPALARMARFRLWIDRRGDATAPVGSVKDITDRQPRTIASGPNCSRRDPVCRGWSLPYAPSAIARARAI